MNLERQMNRSKNRFLFSKIHTILSRHNSPGWLSAAVKGMELCKDVPWCTYGHTQDPAGLPASCAEQLNCQIPAVLLLSDFPNINFYMSQGKRATGKPDYSSQGFLCGPSYFFPMKEVFYNSAMCILHIIFILREVLLNDIHITPS